MSILEDNMVNLNIQSRDNRINLTLNYAIKNNHFEIKAVKKYGRLWGMVLFLFGYASKVNNIYVNTKSLMKHLAEGWCQNKFSEMSNRNIVNEMTKNILKDSTINKKQLNGETIAHLSCELGQYLKMISF